MLKEIHIKNFALIDDIHIDLEDGLCVFTGETGSGKSMIVDAISFAMGKRADKNFVRKGEKKSEIELTFFVDEKTLQLIKPLTIDEGIEIEEGVIFLRREIYEDGRSIAKVNSVSVNLNFMKELTSSLIGIHSQNEYSELEDENHINLLDLYISRKEKFFEIEEYNKSYKNYSEIVKRIKEFKERIGITDRKVQMEELEEQIQEIKKADIKEGEKEELEKKLEIAELSENIGDFLSEFYDEIYDSDNNILNVFSKAIQNLGEFKGLDENLLDLENKSKELFYEIEDLSHQIKASMDRYNYDEDEREFYTQRYNYINEIIGKYGKTYGDLKECYKSSKQKLSELAQSDAIEQKLEEEKHFLRKKLIEDGESLSNKRKDYAKILKKDIILSLESIGMNNVSFEVEISKSKSYNNRGNDDVIFMISFNQGEELKPLIKVASGGELSRFSLAIKSIGLNNFSKTMIFDEIDTGISGIASEMVGKKLKSISKDNQIICITHQSQIASYGDEHFIVYKFEEAGKTYSQVKKLSHDGRIIELAKMIDGKLYSDNSLKFAEELLEKNSK